MDWKKFFALFFRNTLLAVGATSLLLGLLGLILAGKEGLLGGLYWGLILGTIAIPFVAYIALAKAYEGFGGVLGGWIVKNQTGVETTERPVPEPEAPLLTGMGSYFMSNTSEEKGKKQSGSEEKSAK